MTGKIKVMLCATNYLPVFTYGTETWKWTKRDISRL